MKQYAEELGLVTTTRNSPVRIYHRDEKRKTMTFPVNNRTSVDAWASKALKKPNAKSTTKHLFVTPENPPSVTSNTSVLVNTLKRLREQTEDAKAQKLIDDVF